MDAVLDRLGRVSQAIFVCTSISISKLPAWCNFWDKIEESPLRISKEAFQSSLSSNDSLKAFFLETWERTFRAYTRTGDFLTLLKSMDPNDLYFVEGNRHHDQTSDHRSFLDDLASGKTQALTKMMDRDFTAGLLLADTPNEILRRQVQAFFPLLLLGWKQGRKISKTKAEEIERHLLIHYAQTIGCRYADVSLCRSMLSLNICLDKPKEAVQKLQTMLPTFQIWRDTPVSEGADLAIHEKLINRRVKRGRRWLEIIQLMGVDEVVLFNKVEGTLTVGSPLQKLDIADIVENGTTRTFHELKKQLSLPLHSCINETAMKLQGLLPIVLTMASGSSQISSSLLLQISHRINNAFPNLDIKWLEWYESGADLSEFERDYLFFECAVWYNETISLARCLFAISGKLAFRATAIELWDPDKASMEQIDKKLLCLRKHLRNCAITVFVFFRAKRLSYRGSERRSYSDKEHPLPGSGRLSALYPSKRIAFADW